MRIFLLFTLLLTSIEGNAFVEQYFFFDDREIGFTNDSSRIDGEYYSDQLTFKLRLEDQLKFFKSEEAYDLYVGSLSSQDFTTQQRLKLNKQINDRLSFQLAFAKKENFELARSQLVVGLSYLILPKLTVSAYTSLFSEKSNNDLGTALNYELNKKHKISLFYTLPDFSFNERTRSTSLNTQSGSQLGLIGRFAPSENEFLEYYVFRNSPLKRTFPEESRTYEFSEFRTGARGILSFLSFSKLNFEFEHFKGDEGFFTFEENETVDREGLRSLVQVETASWIVGLEHNFRRWRQNTGTVFHRNFMPHIWYRPRVENILKYVDFGLEASIHRATGPRALRAESDSANSDANTRFNTRLNFPFSKTSFLNIMLSLDLDDGSWEGGGGQFQMLF